MDAVNALMEAEWDMDFYKFCEFVGLSAKTQLAKDEWDRLVKAAGILRYMKPSVLARLAEYRKGMVPSAM